MFRFGTGKGVKKSKWDEEYDPSKTVTATLSNDADRPVAGTGFRDGLHRGQPVNSAAPNPFSFATFRSAVPPVSTETNSSSPQTTHPAPFSQPLFSMENHDEFDDQADADATEYDDNHAVPNTTEYSYDFLSTNTFHTFQRQASHTTSNDGAAFSQSSYPHAQVRSYAQQFDEDDIHQGGYYQNSRHDNHHTDFDEQGENDGALRYRQSYFRQQSNVHIISSPMPKLSITENLKLQTTTLHAKNQVERNGKSRWGFITGEETQYAQQKQNLIEELHGLYATEEYDRPVSQTAEMWLQREAAASLIPENKPDNIENTYIGAFEAGFTGSKTKTRCEEFSTAWQAEVLKPSKTPISYPSRLKDGIIDNSSNEETLVRMSGQILLKKSFSTALEQKSLIEVCDERIKQLQPKESTSFGLFNSYKNNNADADNSIAVLNVLAGAAQNNTELSANDWLAFRNDIENVPDSRYYGAFKDKKTREIFDAAETSWRTGAIMEIQDNLKKEYQIDQPRERSTSSSSSKYSQNS